MHFKVCNVSAPKVSDSVSIGCIVRYASHINCKSMQAVMLFALHVQMYVHANLVNEHCCTVFSKHSCVESIY